MNKCVVFESILKSFCSSSFKTKKQLFRIEQTIACRAINTCDTTSSFSLPCDRRRHHLLAIIFRVAIFFSKKTTIFVLLGFVTASRNSRRCIFMASFLQHHCMICKLCIAGGGGGSNSNDCGTVNFHTYFNFKLTLRTSVNKMFSSAFITFFFSCKTLHILQWKFSSPCTYAMHWLYSQDTGLWQTQKGTAPNKILHVNEELVKKVNAFAQQLRQVRASIQLCIYHYSSLGGWIM